MLNFRSRPGHCSRCFGWLGESGAAHNGSVVCYDPQEAKYQLWAANEMARLIAAAPQIKSKPARESLTHFIRSFKEITGTRLDEFADYLGVHEETAFKWLHGDHIPTSEQFAIDLHAQGIYRSAHRLRRELNQPTGLERTQLAELLSDVRGELGISRGYFQRNSGRFTS